MAQKHINYPDNFNEFYEDNDADNVKRIIDWMNASTHRTNRWLSRCVGVSDASISTLLGGKHGTKAMDLIGKILPIIEDSVREKTPGEFVETSTWLLVRHACKIARDESGFAIVAGVPGVGKSKSLEHYKALNPNSIYMCGGEAINSSAVIDMLIDELAIKASKKLRKSTKIDVIVDALKDTQRLIILDEADKCQKDTPDPLRTISDRTGCGVVLAGNVQLRNMVKAGDNRYDLIESRVVFWPQVIHKVSPADAELLMRPYISEAQVNPTETYDELVKYAWELVDGSARKLVKSLVKNVLLLDRQSKEMNQSYKGISREMMRQVAQRFMGMAHPPAIPRRESTI